jgi:N-formylmaleamate deformylase
VIVGHSLGGFLALWLAEKQPDLVGPVVIVDSLPFLAAVMQPGATAESVKPMAENMRKMFSGPPTDETEKQGQASIKSMVTKPEDYEMILGWSKKSDRIAEGNCRRGARCSRCADPNRPDRAGASVSGYPDARR